MFYGHDLNSQREKETMRDKVQISSVLNSGRPIQSQQQLDIEIKGRIALLHLADLIGVPAPSENALAIYIQSKPAFRGADGQFSRDAYTRFVDNIESNPAIDQNIIILVLEEDYRIEKVGKALSGPGYFLDSEARLRVQLNETMFKLSTAEISFDDFDPEITLDEDKLVQFYMDNRQRYEVSERIQAGYIKFPTVKYMNKATNFTEEDLYSHFTNNRARFVAAYEASKTKKEESESPDITSSAVTFEDVRDIVTADLTSSSAQKLANKKAQEFALSLYRNDVKRDSPEFQKLLDEMNLKLVDIPPYAVDEVNSLGIQPKLLEAGFALNEKRYFSDAHEVKDGFAVLILFKRIPPEIPNYEAVAETVKSDYTAEERRHLFSKEGERLKTELSARTFAGTEFNVAAETLGLKVTTLEAFKLSDAPREINRAVLQRVHSMQENGVSPMITSGDSGIFVYLEEKTVPQIDTDNDKLAQISNLLKKDAAFTSLNTLLRELIFTDLEVVEEPAE